jgi:hypothetical protein
MRRSPLAVCLLLVSLPLFAQHIENAKLTRTDASRGVGAAIATIGRSSAPVWVAWTVPTSGGTVCCWSGKSCCGRCTLNGGNGFSINGRVDGSDGPRPADQRALLALRVENGKVRRVRLFSASCSVDGQGAAMHLLTNVTADSSIDYLMSQIRNADREGEMMAALSIHDHPRVVTELIALARRDPDHDVRKHAIFWLGQKAGLKAEAELRRSVDHDPEEDVKEHAVFAISQLPRERSVPLLIDLVKTHKNAAVRKKAMFWLAQTGDPRAIDLLENILLR